MIVRATPRRPVKQPVRRRNRQIVNTGEALHHQAISARLPVFVAITAEPVAAVIMPLTGETYRQLVVVPGPSLPD